MAMTFQQKAEFLDKFVQIDVVSSFQVADKWNRAIWETCRTVKPREKQDQERSRPLDS